MSDLCLLSSDICLLTSVICTLSSDQHGRISNPMELSSFVLQQIINAIFLGSIYSLFALGYTMVYGIIELINFAHGELFTAGAFIGVIVLTALQQAAWVRAQRTRGKSCPSKAGEPIIFLSSLTSPATPD